MRRPTGARPAKKTEERVGDDSKVEELFARIREGRVSEPAEPAFSDPGNSATASSDTPIGMDAETGTVATALDPETERLMAERDDLLDPIIARMARRLKRAMQDDQNLLLHRLRSDSGEYRQELLSSEDEQRRGLVEASVDFLGDAFDAGEAFARQQLGTEDGHCSRRDRDQPLGGRHRRPGAGRHRRHAAAPPAPRGGRRGPGTDRGGGRRAGQRRLPRVARASGSSDWWATTSSGRSRAGCGPPRGKTPLRWIASGSDEACADCDDNALAEAVAEGERFPTGHLHPPGPRRVPLPRRADPDLTNPRT